MRARSPAELPCLRRRWQTSRPLREGAVSTHHLVSLTGGARDGRRCSSGVETERGGMGRARGGRVGLLDCHGPRRWRTCVRRELGGTTRGAKRSMGCGGWLEVEEGEEYFSMEKHYNSVPPFYNGILRDDKQSKPTFDIGGIAHIS